MKKAVIAVLITLLVVVIVVAISIILFFTITDTKSTVPKIVEEVCKIKEDKYMGRSVFTISPGVPQEDSSAEKNVVEENNKEDLEKDASNKPTILYFHGGAYMAEVTQNHWNFISKLVNDTGSTVVLVDYPLTPKYNYKDVFDMIEPLYKEIANQVGTDNLILLGDSAGGGIALALEEKISEQNISMPKKTILISPWLDVRLTNEKIEEVKKLDDRLNEQALKLAGVIYAANDGIDSYLVNPIDGDLSKLKNVIILTGTNDILNPDVDILKEKAKSVNTTIEVKEFENADHIWIINETSSQELIDEGYNEVAKLITEQ